MGHPVVAGVGGTDASAGMPANAEGAVRARVGTAPAGVAGSEAVVGGVVGVGVGVGVGAAVFDGAGVGGAGVDGVGVGTMGVRVGIGTVGVRVGVGAMGVAGVETGAEGGMVARDGVAVVAGVSA